jgi:hypothetical protein
MLCCFKHPLRGNVAASGKEQGIVSHHTTVDAGLLLGAVLPCTLKAPFSSAFRFRPAPVQI